MEDGQSKPTQTARSTPATSSSLSSIIDDSERLKALTMVCWTHKQQLPCPVCAEIAERRAGMVYEEGPDKEEIKAQARRRALFDHPEEAMRKAGVGMRYISCSFESFQGGEPLKELCRTPGDLVLIGNTGSGKTHLAVSVLREWVRVGKEAQFITAPELLMEIRESYRAESYRDESEIIDRYGAVGMLVLDDLGAEKTTDWSVDRLYLIIDRRYRDALPTVVTTNLSLEQIEKQLSPRIASRLSGMRVVTVKLPDWRKKR